MAALQVDCGTPGWMRRRQLLIATRGSDLFCFPFSEELRNSKCHGVDTHIVGRVLPTASFTRALSLCIGLLLRQ